MKKISGKSDLSRRRSLQGTPWPAIGHNILEFPGFPPYDQQDQSPISYSRLAQAMSSGLDPKIFPGLSEEEAAQRLLRDGYNELPSSRGRSVWAVTGDVVREPMFLLLVTCGTLYLFLGDVHEALMLLGFVFVVMGITLYQERKTERALEALRDLSSPRALVIRDGRERRIAGREVVRGDILVAKEGDRIPADAVLLSCLSLCVDESLLTGESAPVRKSADPCASGMDGRAVTIFPSFTRGRWPFRASASPGYWPRASTPRSGKSAGPCRTLRRRNLSCRRRRGGWSAISRSLDFPCAPWSLSSMG